MLPELKVEVEEGELNIPMLYDTFSSRDMIFSGNAPSSVVSFAHALRKYQIRLPFAVQAS